METRGTLKSKAETELEIAPAAESVVPPCAANAADDVDVEAGTGTTVSVTVALFSPQVPATD